MNAKASVHWSDIIKTASALALISRARSFAGGFTIEVLDAILALLPGGVCLA